VPRGLRNASEWAWRLLVLTAAIGLGLWLLVKLRLIVFPVIVALFLCALLATPVRRLTDRGMRRGWATLTVMTSSLIGLVAIFILVGSAVSAGVRDVGVNATKGVDEIKNWLITGPFNLDQADIDKFEDQLSNTVSDNQDRIVAGALQSATLLFEVVAGGILALFVTVFLLYDGPRVWRWCVGLFPRRTAPHLDEAGRRAWIALSGYVRGTIAVAFVDGFFITIWLLILRVPLAIPLGVLVFFGGFVPLVGATVTGALAVLVALVTKGTFTALLTLGGIILVQQLEGHILQPLLMGRFVRIHPLAIILAIGAGGILAGIGGAVIAVPTVAVVNSVVKYWAENARAGLPDWPPPQEPQPPLRPDGPPERDTVSAELEPAGTATADSGRDTDPGRTTDSPGGAAPDP
jgi:predicted PurR-regulated permease PerM